MQKPYIYLIRFLKHPIYIVYVLGVLFGSFKFLSDTTYLKLCVRGNLGYTPNIENPTTFNEKLQWLKLNNRREIYSQMVDKYAVREYVSNRIGSKYLVPLLGVWDTFDKIDFDSLPGKFVLKCTHDSGSVIICKDKSTFNKSSAEKKMRKHLSKNFYYAGREWPYKNVPPKIIAEEFIDDPESDILRVYKLFNFNGVPRIIQVVNNDKQKNESINYYSPNWELLPFRQGYPNTPTIDKKPTCLTEMLDLSASLSQNIPFLRVDFYEVNSKLFFSEFTFFPDGGFGRFHPKKWDWELGSWIQLPNM